MSIVPIETSFVVEMMWKASVPSHFQVMSDTREISVIAMINLELSTDGKKNTYHNELVRKFVEVGNKWCIINTTNTTKTVTAPFIYTLIYEVVGEVLSQCYIQHLRFSDKEISHPIFTDESKIDPSMLNTLHFLCSCLWPTWVHGDLSETNYAVKDNQLFLLDYEPGHFRKLQYDNYVCDGRPDDFQLLAFDVYMFVEIWKRHTQRDYYVKFLNEMGYAACWFNKSQDDNEMFFISTPANRSKLFQFIQKLKQYFTLKGSQRM